ncbi:hypothetical protein KIL84_015269 [Mauremys mutica]|uniref:Uncharacterized protein n=1 Tax=Mauremys mutica TaxID=74926 RepID=A0A9D3WRY2_9SAUR|nr:hypothetical protein KIL84_015269 [Mauremys mutica]
MQLILNCKHIINLTLSAHLQHKSSSNRLWQQDYNRSQQQEFTWKTKHCKIILTHQDLLAIRKICDKCLFLLRHSPGQMLLFESLNYYFYSPVVLFLCALSAYIALVAL